MEPEKLKGIIRSYIEAINKNDPRALDGFFAPNLRTHTLPTGYPRGTEGLKTLISTYQKAFTNFKLKVDDIITEGDTVVVLWSATGKHTDDFMGSRATGSALSIAGCSVYKISRDGKITDHWNFINQLDVLKQLGVDVEELQRMPAFA